MVINFDALPTCDAQPNRRSGSAIPSVAMLRGSSIAERDEITASLSARRSAYT